MTVRVLKIANVCAALAAVALSLFACDDDDPPPCWNGDCVCRPGDSCQLPCFQPPCHIDCAGDNPTCVGQCGNGECHCGPGSHCRFTCQSPPCHVGCEPATDCAGTCANGTCRCDTGSSCQFSCASGPCHVECAGQNPTCDGECMNGSCSCGANSSCRFACNDGNCHASCGTGSRCVLECPEGRAGEQGCRFETCASGEPVICPGGQMTVCGMACP